MCQQEKPRATAQSRIFEVHMTVFVPLGGAQYIQMLGLLCTLGGRVFAEEMGLQCSKEPFDCVSLGSYVNRHTPLEQSSRRDWTNTCDADIRQANRCVRRKCHHQCLCH